MMEIQKKLHEELQTIGVINNKLQKKYETVMAIEVDMQLELERVQIANDSLNKQWESKMKDWEEEKKILFIENQILPKEMEAVKTKLPWNWNNLTFTTTTSINIGSPRSRIVSQKRKSLLTLTRCFRRNWQQARPTYQWRFCSWLVAVLNHNKAISGEQIQLIKGKCHYTISISSEGWVKVELGRWSWRKEATRRTRTTVCYKGFEKTKHHLQQYL